MLKRNRWEERYGCRRGINDKGRRREKKKEKTETSCSENRRKNKEAEEDKIKHIIRERELEM